MGKLLKLDWRGALGWVPFFLLMISLGLVVTQTIETFSPKELPDWAEVMQRLLTSSPTIVK